MNMFLDVVSDKKPIDTTSMADGNIGKSHKLFLIAMLLRGKNGIGRYDYFSISEEISDRYSVYISPDDCKKIIEEYRFLISRPNAFSMTLTILTGLFLMYISGHNVINIAIIILFSPSTFNFYNNFLVTLRLFSFNPKDIIPTISFNEEQFKTISIIIASRNEPFAVAKMTFDSAMSLHYPYNKKQIVVVDNSDVEFEGYEKWKSYVEAYKKSNDNVEFIHRNGTEGFKPGNLDMALQNVTGEYILYMDVDSTLTKDTLLRVMPLFGYDEKLAFIQLQAIPANAKGKSTLAMAQSIQNYFLRIGTIFLSHSSHCLFYGHNAIWKTEVVREMGECLEYYNNEVIVTEDLSMSLRALFKGYHGSGTWIESGEWVPESLRETESMWLRWTVGTYQVYGKHVKNICKLIYKKPKDFSGWMQHIISLTNNGMTPVYIFIGMILNSNLLMFMALLSMLPDIAQTIFASIKFSLGRASLVEKFFHSYKGTFILSTYLNWIKLIGIFRFLTKQKQGWKPTGKAPEESLSMLQIVSRHYLYVLFGLFCITYSLHAVIFNPLTLAGTLLFSICGIYGVHSVLSVCIFGGSRMMESTEDAAGRGNIEDYLGFYNKDTISK